MSIDHKNDQRGTECLPLCQHGFKKNTSILLASSMVWQMSPACKGYCFILDPSQRLAYRQLTYMEPYEPCMELKALHSLFHWILMIACKVDSHSHVKAKKTDTKRVSNLPTGKTGTQNRAGPQCNAAPPQGGALPTSSPVKGVFYFSSPGAHALFFATVSFWPNAEAISILESFRPMRACPPVSVTNSRSEKKQNSLKEAAVPWINKACVIRRNQILLAGAVKERIGLKKN